MDEIEIATIVTYFVIVIFSLLLTRWIDNKKLPKENTDKIKAPKKPNFLERSFSEIKYYKVFIVLQLFLIIVLIIYDITNSRWDLIFSYSSYSGFRIDSTLFERSKTTVGDYLTIATVIIPIFISKSLDWVLKGNKNRPL